MRVYIFDTTPEEEALIRARIDKVDAGSCEAGSSIACARCTAAALQGIGPFTGIPASYANSLTLPSTLGEYLDTLVGTKHQVDSDGNPTGAPVRRVTAGEYQDELRQSPSIDTSLVPLHPLLIPVSPPPSANP